MTLFSCIGCGVEWYVECLNNEFEAMWNETFVAYFKVLARNLGKITPPT